MLAFAAGISAGTGAVVFRVLELAEDHADVYDLHANHEERP